jgi:predicted RNase H-like HicB family nuclease
VPKTLLNTGNKYPYTIQGADMEFNIAIEQDEDGWYIVTVPSLPGCVSQGRTEEEAKKNIAEAIELHLSALARDGIPLCHPPG